MTLPALIIAGAVAVAAASAIIVFLVLRQSARTTAEIQQEMRDAFAALSRDALRDTNASLLQTADHALRARQEAIDELIKPVRETLDKVQQQVVRADRDREGSFRAVKEQLASLAQAQELLRQSADGLSRSLRSPNTRGKWGEIQLKRIVELAGMLERCDFELQESTPDTRLRPDLTVRLPGNTRIVVDSKVPIDAYLRAVEAATEEHRNRHLDEHAAMVRAHVKTLGNKRYWDQFEGHSPEFVVMFLPLEPLMSAAFERDPELLEFAARENVVIATPMTLLALLRAVAFGWQQQDIARNAEEIRDAGQELCDRLVKMLAHFDDAGAHLGGAVDSFNKAVGSFDRRVMPSVRRFQELKVPQADQLALPVERPAIVRSFKAPALPGEPDDDGT
ncbi:MAG: DNA recombination protein RmuC [Acidobacteria bacterium]|nr:MAG: DNA recombination protein RmuC [Acidobacteriota bacterium]